MRGGSSSSSSSSCNSQHYVLISTTTTTIEVLFWHIRMVSFCCNYDYMLAAFSTSSCEEDGDETVLLFPPPITPPLIFPMQKEIRKSKTRKQKAKKIC